jgi:hypothetical protein
MSTEEQKATLRLRIVGPLEGETEAPIGATAWITSEDDEPIVVSIPSGHTDNPATVQVSHGRVVVVLRVPAGRKGRQSFVLQPGECKEIEFGTAPEPLGLDENSFFGGMIGRDFVDIDSAEPDHPEENHIDFDPRDPSGENNSASHGGMMQTSWSGSSGSNWGTKDPTTPQNVDASSWIPLLQSIRAIACSEIENGRFDTYVVARNAIAPEVHRFESSASRLRFSLRGCVVFVVEPAGPYQDKVLVHRAAWTHEFLQFGIKLRSDGASVPFDSDIVLGDDRIMPLLSFLAGGDMYSARAQTARFAKSGAGYLHRKFGNHHMAALGAYALLMLRQTDVFADWIQTLYSSFNDISDGAIIYATHLMRARPGAVSEWYDAARDALTVAAKRPLPILTIGVHLLVDGLERLTSSQRSAGDDELARALERARWIQARARYDETFTALWINKDELRQALEPLDWDAIIARG